MEIGALSMLWGQCKVPKQETDWNDGGIDDSPCGWRVVSKRE